LKIQENLGSDQESERKLNEWGKGPTFSSKLGKKAAPKVWAGLR